MTNTEIVDGYIEFLFRNLSKCEPAFQVMMLKSLASSFSINMMGEVITSEHFLRWCQQPAIQQFMKGK